MQQGGLIIYPTETFYALGADHTNFTAIERLLILKGRGPQHPLPLILSSCNETAKLCAPCWPAALVEKLCTEFWPGPLTVILPAAIHLHPALCSPPTAPSGSPGVAVRLSSHPVAAAVAKLLGRAIISTSANLTGHPPCNLPQALDPILLEGTDLLMDAGPCPGQQPSTIVDLRHGPPYRVARQGAITLCSSWLE